MHNRLRSLRPLGRWKTPRPRNKLHFSLHYRTIVFYTAVSLLLAIALMTAGVTDLILLLALEKPQLTTHKSLVTIMVNFINVSFRTQACSLSSQLLHCITFYLSVLGFIHSFEASLFTLTNLSTVAGGREKCVCLVLHALSGGAFFPRSVCVITSDENHSRTGISRVLPTRVCCFLASNKKNAFSIEKFTHTTTL